MHLRLFELAKDHLTGKGIRVLGGIVSPVNDGYEKKSLTVNSSHRVKMVNLALQNYDFVKCSEWEAEQSQWTRTRAVLDHYDSQLAKAMKNDSKKCDWIPDLSDAVETPRLLLVCGGDLLETFSTPGLWQEEDIVRIVKNYGLVVISREGSNPEKYVYEHDILHKYKENIHFVTERVPNDISSTRIRRCVQRGESVRFLVPDAVIDYIYANNLYRDISKDSKNEEINEYYARDSACSIDVSPKNSNITVHEPECNQIESPVLPFPNIATDTKTVVSDEQQITLIDDTDCMKTEKECMAASASSSDTFDIIDSKDLEHLNIVSKDTVENDDAKTNAVDNAKNASSSTNTPLSGAAGDIDIASIDTCKPCQSPCNLSRVNEDEEEEDCSCTTTGSRSPTPVHFEITARGVKVISDRESFL